MGSSQSKKSHKLENHHQQQIKWTAERLQRDSIVAAIAANKRQRKLLMKQAKLAAATSSKKGATQSYRSQQHSLTPTALGGGPFKAISRLKAQSHQQLNYTANSSPLYYSPNLHQEEDVVPFKGAHYAHSNHQMFQETVNYPIVGGLYTNGGGRGGGGAVVMDDGSLGGDDYYPYDNEEELACQSQEEENYENHLPADCNNVGFDSAGGLICDDYQAYYTNQIASYADSRRLRRQARRYLQQQQHEPNHDRLLNNGLHAAALSATTQFPPTNQGVTTNYLNKNNIKVKRHHASRQAGRQRFLTGSSNKTAQQGKSQIRENYSGSLASGVDKLGALPLASQQHLAAIMSSSQTELNSLALEEAQLPLAAQTSAATTRQSTSRENLNIKASKHATRSSNVISSAAGAEGFVAAKPEQLDGARNKTTTRLHKDTTRHLAQQQQQQQQQLLQEPFRRGSQQQEQYNNNNNRNNINNKKGIINTAGLSKNLQNPPSTNHHQQNSHSSISLTYSSQSQLSTTSSSRSHLHHHHHHYRPEIAPTNFIPDTLYHLNERQNQNNHNRTKYNYNLNNMHPINHTSSTTNSQLTTTTSSSFYNQMYYQSKVQKGLAYSDDERRALNLQGLLPAAKQDLELQIKGVVNFIKNCQDELSKYIYLRHLKDFNERLFYSTLIKNVELLMPLVYTPTVGLACQRFSEIYLRPRGMFITINDLNKVSLLLNNWPEKDVRVIVVTDGERILGLGDLGANGMGISIGKLSLYTALAGIPPQNVLPITIDVGTNNQFNLSDPYYIGLRQQRVRGEKYDQLLEEFMKSVVDRWGRSCLIQFEDFANSTAFNLLERYRDKYCTFNDDIQGTASVCLSGLISASSKLLNKRLSDSSYLFYGAGEANLGTANLLIMAMMEESGDGITLEEARSKIWLVDSKGLVVSSRTDLSEHKRAFAQNVVGTTNKLIDLIDIIEHTKPLAIIGASAQGGAFNEEVCKKMAQLNDRPIIFALSNPTSKAECTAKQAYEWTDGKCVFASGSPFDPVEFNGKTYVTGQGNNAYIFPAVGLAAIAAHVHTIPEDTFLVAAKALSDQLSEHDISIGLVYPKLNRIREVTLKVATRVLEHFYTERLATYRPEPDDKLNFLRSIQYDCRYEAIEPISPSSFGQMSLTNANNHNRAAQPTANQ